MWSPCLLAVGLCLIGVSYCQLSSEMSVRLGNNVRLPCRLTQDEIGDPDTVNVRWYSKKESWLTAGTRVYKHRDRIEVDKTTPTEWNLKINKVDQSFADVYKCVTDNKEISIITLKILVAPKINVEASTNQAVSFPEFSMAEMRCVFIGEPKPDVTWYRGYGADMTPIGITGPVLRIRDVTRYATDVYTCRGTNTVNHYDHVINATVTFEPEVYVKEDKVYASIDESEIPVLSCMIQGSPIYRAYWLDNKGKEIQYANHWKFQVYEDILPGKPVRFLRLLLRKATWGKRDYGTYKCVARGETTVQEKTVELIDKADMPITYTTI